MATQAEVAAHLDLTRQAVGELVQRGVLPAAEPGQLDLDACRAAYLRHLRDTGAARSESDLASWRTELAREQVAKLHRENAAARAELIPAAEVGPARRAVFDHCRARLLEIPAAAAPRLAAMRGAACIRDELRDQIHHALDDLARTEVRAADPPHDPGTDDTAP